MAMLVAPSPANIGRTLTREVAERLARNWWMLLLNGLVLIVAGVLIFSIDWTIRSLATFIGTTAIAGAFAARRLLPVWWLLLILGLLEVPLGVLALADPGATLAALITVGGIWAVAVGVMRVVLAFELRQLPDELDRLWERGAGRT
jgi:uncharacterized membrane protein HdeD (DUF308 family)